MNEPSLTWIIIRGGVGLLNCACIIWCIWGVFYGHGLMLIALPFSIIGAVSQFAYVSQEVSRF